jgi:hypothetical protein
LRRVWRRGREQGLVVRRVIRGKDRRRRVMVMVGSKKWRGSFGDKGAEGLRNKKDWVLSVREWEIRSTCGRQHRRLKR